jgi:hypothetical protein
LEFVPEGGACTGTTTGPGERQDGDGVHGGIRRRGRKEERFGVDTIVGTADIEFVGDDDGASESIVS